jgi:hypothetical protein
MIGLAHEDAVVEVLAYGAVGRSLSNLARSAGACGQVERLGLEALDVLQHMS